ncbi:MAG: DUF5693 family protein [Candidatus Eremiobacteraeota bacterium]|nr:DUF5693 family protein [Candidatus Eremiobacteraeota bacterium]
MQTLSLRQVAIALVVLGAAASILVAADRWRFETANRSVEITIDQQDLADFAHSYGYDWQQLLAAMRDAGLTSVAVYEETGQRVNAGNHAYVQSGQQLINAARLSPLSDRTLRSLLAAHAIDASDVYISVYDGPTLARYLKVLRTQLQPKTVRVVRGTLPALIAVKTQLDFFNGLGLGIAADVSGPIRRLGLLVDPRVADNERLGPREIDAVFAQMLVGGRIGTVIFFGQANAVLGYPFNLPATGDEFKSRGINFGDVEAYDPSQVQKGSQTLAREIVGQTVRVQAISKLEMDKLDIDTIVARYVLGVRERNIRVVYLRPFPHVIQQTSPDGRPLTLSAEQANLQMIGQLRARLAESGFTTGRAAGFVDFKSSRLQLLYALAALGVTAGFLLLLDLYGCRRAWMAWAAYGLTVVLFVGAAALGHGITVRKLWALGAALTFGILAGTTLGSYFRRPEEAAASAGGAARRGLVCLSAAVGLAALGGLFVTGLLSQAVFMIEAEQFAGVKVLYVVTPLALLWLYFFTDRFCVHHEARRLWQSPVRAWQLAALSVVALAGILLIARSGNQSDVGVSDFESHLRGALTVLLGARPRFKQFLIGFPALVLLPALSSAHRSAVGWLLILAAGVGLADVLDTFSHIHTPLVVDLVRLLNGLVLGYIIGLLVQAAYRIFVREPAATRP